MMKIDWQGERIYAAEWIVRKHLPRRFDPKLAKIRKWVKSVIDNEWFHENFQIENIRVLPSRGATPEASAESKTIRMPVWSREPLTVLHEIAHICNKSKKTRRASHGKEFAWILLNLTKHFLGQKEYSLLKKSFNRFKVNYSWKNGPICTT